MTGQEKAELEDRILVEALGELGATAGGAGGLLGGGLGGLFGGRSGGRRGLGPPPGNCGRTAASSSSQRRARPRWCCARRRQLVSSEGRLIEDEEIPAQPQQVWALVVPVEAASTRRWCGSWRGRAKAAPWSRSAASPRRG